jgi:mannitol-specific phosphotransferase system IIBC component
MGTALLFFCEPPIIRGRGLGILIAWSVFTAGEKTVKRKAMHK